MEQRAYDSAENTAYKVVLRPTTTTETTMLHLERVNQVADNQNYKAYEVKGEIPVSGIVYIDSKPNDKCVTIARGKEDWHFETETYEDYERRCDEYGDENTEWIRKILSGRAEREKVLSRMPEFIVAYDWKFDQIPESDGKIDNRKLHLLGIPKTPIRSIRDIRPEHIPLLQQIKAEGLRVCNDKYGVDASHTKIYFHYPPSTYHLHIHFTWVGKTDEDTTFERALDFDSVIENIKRHADYYKGDMRVVWI